MGDDDQWYSAIVLWSMALWLSVRYDGGTAGRCCDDVSSLTKSKSKINRCHSSSSNRSPASRGPLPSLAVIPGHQPGIFYVHKYLHPEHSPLRRSLSLVDHRSSHVICADNGCLLNFRDGMKGGGDSHAYFSPRACCLCRRAALQLDCNETGDGGWWGERGRERGGITGRQFSSRRLLFIDWGGRRDFYLGFLFWIYFRSPRAAEMKKKKKKRLLDGSLAAAFATGMHNVAARILYGIGSLLLFFFLFLRDINVTAALLNPIHFSHRDKRLQRNHHSPRNEF